MEMKGERFPGISGLRFYADYSDRRKRNKNEPEFS